MCNMASFVLTKNDCFWSEKSDSHEDIIKENKLNDKTTSPDFVRIEISPPNNDYSLPIKQWIYKVDQDYLPSWYNAEWCESVVREQLKYWYKLKVIKRNRNFDIIDRNIIVLKGVTKIKNVVSGGNVRSFKNSTINIETVSGGYVVSYENSTINIETVSDGYVVSYENSTINIETVSDGYVVSWDNSIMKIENDRSAVYNL